MASQTTPIYPSSTEKRKDDNSDRTASNSHAHILPAPSAGHGDQHVKFQPLQKTTIVARPIAPAPIQAQMTSHTLARVGPVQTVGSALPSNTLVSTGAPSALLASAGGSLSHSLTGGTSTAATVSQPGMIQIASSVSGAPMNSMMRGAPMQPGSGHMQFPSHLPKGAAAAVSALTGPKSGQTVATAILRPGTQGATIQIPVSSTPSAPQTFHQHIQPRGGTLQGALVTPVRPGTPPITRASSPVITAQLQQHVDPAQAHSRSQPNSMQLTLPQQRTNVEMSAKLQASRAGAGEVTGKAPARMLVDTSVKLQPGKTDSLTKLQPPRTMEATAKTGQFQRSVVDPGGKTPAHRTTAGENSGKMQQRSSMDASSAKISVHRPVMDPTGKVLSAKVIGDLPGKVQTHVQTVPWTMLDTTGPKVQAQKLTGVEASNKIPLDSSGAGKLQLQRTALDGAQNKVQVVRATADTGEKVQIQRVSRDTPGKMPQHRGGLELSGKPLQSHLSHPQTKTVHLPQPYASTPLSSKVVLSQVPVTSVNPQSHQGLHQPITSKPIKPGVMPLSVSSISSQLNTNLSVPSLTTITTCTGITSTMTTTSIPIAKVTPQRHHQPQLAPLTGTTSTTTTPGVISMTTGTGTVTVQDMHIGAQPQVGGVYMSSVNRGSAGATPITTSMAMSGQPTHGDTRTERASGVTHMGQFICSDYYTGSYGMPPGAYQTMVYPNITTSQALPQGPLRPRLITSPTPNLAASLQASIQGGGSVTRLPHTMLQVDSSRSLQTHFPANTEGSSLTSEAVTITVTSGLPTYTLSPAGPTITSTQPSQNTPGHSSQSASPRPSILRKRTSDGTPVKKPYCALNDNQSPRPESAPQSNNSSPKTPVTESRENSQSSTDTALSNEAAPLTSEFKVKQELTDPADNSVPVLNNVEASPRKKPRKQLLSTVEEIRDATSSDEEVERHMEVKEERRDSIKQEVKEDFYDEEGVRWTVERTKPNISIMNFYNCSWKARNNHFNKYQDVKPKEERRPTVNELSNSKSVLQKATGWRLYYMAAQLEDLNDLEKQMCSQITDIQSSLAPRVNTQSGAHTEEVAASRVHELTQGNIQRCQLVNDQLAEARNSMLKILDHKKRILEIINKHMSKRPIKKKERS
ncbi:histone deacetylase complex subunit SAP130-A-like [Liolophura sinensis]|uniref:histone deacetylase complex subunit SAP130-A-like n=1 Tax=Liolophura sinensis TaxID=3198878 RepID=UPI0031582B85